MIPPHTPISSATELADMWQTLMGPDGFAQSTLWVVFFDEHDPALAVHLATRGQVRVFAPDDLTGAA